ncbi:MAG: MBL fold metallo-hydrolase [Planctomycetota bacterium]|jgi:glyoxylase-like metal-dependent hydrolase (beta-lactamase superfamily II)
MLNIGRFQILSVINGRFGLDGGAMFGVVPKVLWERKTKADELNRIPLAMRTLVAIDAEAGRVVLVDTGAGHKWPADEAQRFAIEPYPHALAQALAPYGLAEADVTDVIVTHLHFDHNGGLTEWQDRPPGETRLRFPQARHWIHERHWQHATHPTEKDAASFLERDLQALAEPGVLTFVAGDSPPPPFEGVHWHLSHGHTPYQLLPVFEGEDGDLLFVGDMIPTANHLPVPWVMAYDLRPLVTIEEKGEVHSRCTREGLVLAFPHDPGLGGVGMEVVDGKPVVSKTLDL